MAAAFDPRIIQVSIAFPDETLTFEGLSIYATGRKFQAAPQNTCECRIYNLTKEHRNYIITKTSPLLAKRVPIQMALNVGRESYGTFRLFEGYVMSNGTTQPPDIGLSFISLTSNFLIGKILSDTQSSYTQLSVIAQNIAANNSLTLSFLATDKQIDCYSYNGCAAYQIQDLNEMGGVVAYVDDNVLIVTDAGSSRNKGFRTVSAETGMVGIPQFIERGVRVKMMIDNTVQLGDTITIQSKMLPAADGDYVVQAMLFEVASRDQQFFYTLDCRTVNYYPGTV